MKTLLLTMVIFAQDVSVFDEMRLLLNSPEFREEVACKGIDKLEARGEADPSLVEFCATVPQTPGKKDIAVLMFEQLTKIEQMVNQVKAKAETNKRDINTLRNSFLSFQTPYPATITPRPAPSQPSRTKTRKDPFWR